MYLIVRFDKGEPILLFRSGSSTPKTYRAFATIEEARRSVRRSGGKIIKVNTYEIVE